MNEKVIAVTPAGRRCYLEILSRYVLRDDSISEWHLWDNCRNEDDRNYLSELRSRAPEKIRLVTIDNPTGTNRSVNQFYRFLTDKNAFYVKMDDDIVYLPPNFGAELLKRASGERERYLWWSPLVINNALCSWLLRYHTKIRFTTTLSAQANDKNGWNNPAFSVALHRYFLRQLNANKLSQFIVPNFEVSLSRFSINCIGMFGDDIVSLGDQFCPPDVDDEEWISAYLPSLTRRPGRVLGDLLVSHFSFFTQEEVLLQTDLLDEYARVVGLSDVGRPRAPRKRTTLRSKLRSRVRGLVASLVPARVIILDPIEQ